MDQYQEGDSADARRKKRDISVRDILVRDIPFRDISVRDKFDFESRYARDKRHAAVNAECISKFDSEIDVVYELDGTCKCTCGKSKEEKLDRCLSLMFNNVFN